MLPDRGIVADRGITSHILILDFVVVNLLMLSLSVMILLYLAAPFFTQRCLCMIPFQGYIKFVSLLFPLISPCEVIHNNLYVYLAIQVARYVDKLIIHACLQYLI